MKFIFTCPLKQDSFFSEEFQITENQGVAVDETGNRYLNARIRLTAPCPLCGRYHEYHANELACPFGSDVENRK
jgi:hypothetical protein